MSSNQKVQTIDDRTFGRPIEKDYYLSEDWQIHDIDGHPYVSARFAARKLEYENTNDFTRIVESCISSGQITEDQFVYFSDFTVTNRKVQTIDDASFGRPIEKDYYLSEDWQLHDIDGHPYVSARFAARKLEYEKSVHFIAIIESCIERGQITEDQFVQHQDFVGSTDKVQTTNDVGRQFWEQATTGLAVVFRRKSKNKTFDFNSAKGGIDIENRA